MTAQTRMAAGKSHFIPDFLLINEPENTDSAADLNREINFGCDIVP